MDPKSHIQGLTHLSTTYRLRHHQRNQETWKVIFTTLGLHVAAVAAVYKGEVRFNIGTTILVAVALFVITAAAVSVLLRIFLGHNRDLLRAYNVEEGLVDVSAGKKGSLTNEEISASRADMPTRWKGFRKHPDCYFYASPPC